MSDTTQAFVGEVAAANAAAGISSTSNGIIVGADPVTPDSKVVSPNLTVAHGVKFFTEEDIARAREQEKSKLYPQVEKLREELAAFQEKDRAAQEEARMRAEAEAEAARRQAESEMDVRSLLEQKEAEWQQRLEEERAERERAFALLERERAFQELESFRQSRLAEEADNIIPELADLVSGNTPEEIEQSIAGLKERSSRILESAQSAMQNARRDMAGTRVTAPSTGPLDIQSAQQTLTAADIAAMPFDEYVKHRSKLLGANASGGGRGLFG